jgi:hypothetical protein
MLDQDERSGIEIIAYDNLDPLPVLGNRTFIYGFCYTFVIQSFIRYTSGDT